MNPGDNFPDMPSFHVAYFFAKATLLSPLPPLKQQLKVVNRPKEVSY